jgi:hypothetical protein
MLFLPGMAADDDDRDVSDAEYAELRRYIPAHARSRTPHKKQPDDSRVGVLEWLGDIAHAVVRKLRRP